MKKLNYIAFLLVLVFSCVVQAVTFTSNTTISASNKVYDGNDIVVDGCTVTINGIHDFNSLHITNNGVITHTAGDASFNLTITGDMTIDSGSSINADGKGYASDTGPGAGHVGFCGGSGGGYGGVGGYGCGVSGCGGYCLGGPTYGSLTEPTDLGSGGGRSGGSGGGAIRLTVGGALTVEGEVRACGQFTDSDSQCGGGSGGSIWITTGALKGSGVIVADGGNGGDGLRGWGWGKDRSLLRG